MSTQEISTSHAGEPQTVSALFEALEARIDAMTRRLTDEEAEGMYARARQYADAGQTSQARRLLCLLTIFKPDEPRYWHAVGVCWRRENEPLAAVRALERAIELDPKNLQPGFLLVESLLILGQRAEAAALLEMVEGTARERNDLSGAMRAQGLRELLMLPLQ